ncbi:desmoplakin-like isoform X1 [Solea senegalensis]|uniref:Desmoplakin-like isoform X1 n=1 Tax=Solea senegalensis TaxID=28829 RepID=A0AAV6SBF5_SOLSE|nr:desmoplakin isoform X1 [Solea senegalensis]KAG7514579.1 desmoplakin-like isoform X1 [Solea senegalensis]
MSYYGSQQGLNVSRRAGSKSDLTTGGTYPYSRSEILQGGGNGYDQYMDGFKSVSYSRSSKGGMVCTMPGGMSGGMVTGMSGGMVGMPGGMVSTMPGGMVSGMTGGMVSGMSGGMVSGMSGGMSGGMVSGMSGGMVSGMSGGMSGGSNLSVIHQRAMNLQAQCQEYLKKAEYALQSGGSSGEAEQYMAMAKETIEQLKSFALDLRHMGQPNDNVVRTLELCKDQLKGVHMAITGSMRRRSTRKSSGGSWEEPGRSFHDALGWIAQQKRLIETAQWGDDPAAIQQQLNSHQNYHSSIQRSMEVDRARDDLVKKGDKGNLHALEQEWDSLQQMSFGRTEQLQELLQVLQDISKEIMWVNDREEEELVFDWGDKNIEQYIPRKQESYSKLMSSLEAKEKDLNKLKSRVDTLLKNSHPASEKIEAYQDTLQTQWSWLLQITKCIDTHLKENAAYSQFFKEANETYSSLQKEHENVRKKFTCDKNTSLENLLDLLKELERERERIMDNKRQVQHVVNKSKSIVRLKPRNPEEKSSSHLIVKALCDFKQDQKLIHKGDEAILKDNSQRSKWHVTGPGGLDMLVPSVCLIIPPPNPLCVSLANKNDQYYEAILSIWNQLYINVKSLIAWQFCLMDIKRIKSLTMSMLIKMRPEEYHQIIKSLESHYEEFKRTSHGSQMFVDDDKRSIENQFSEAQTHYNQLVVQLPTYIVQYQQEEARQAADQQNQLIIIQQQQQQDAADAEARRLEEERYRAERKRLAEKKVTTKKEHVIKKEVVKVNKTEPAKRKVLSPSPSSSRSLSELHALRLRLEETEGSLSQHVHICLGEEGMHDCGLRITKLETTQSDIDAIRQEFLHLREQILRELEGMSDPDKAQFLRSELSIIDQRLGGLEGSSSAYLQRLRALRDMLESVARAEDIVKVHEARLTEKETASLSPSEVEDYILALKNVKAELDQKKDLLTSMEAELSNVNHWNGQVGGAFHRCDMVMSKYREQVGLLSDRWRRIQGQMDTRLQDLQLYLPQLQHYKKSSSSLSEWIDATRKKQDVLQSTKIDSVHTLKQHITNQKELNSEIKARREVLESVLKDNEACVNSVKDYEMYLASYTSGLETLLNIPIKRTMLRSPTMDLSQEATQLQTRYMELLTQSGDYYRFLGDLLKNMEELKMRNTRIDLLEEELRLLREDIQDRNSKNKSLEDAVARYQLELSQSQNQLLSMEEVKRHTALQTSATKESLDSTHNQLADLNDQVARLNYLLEEEKMKRRLAEERYSQQKEEFESVLRKRQKELETVSWSKVEMEKSVVGKDNEIEQLRRQLADEAARNKELQREMSKVRSQCSNEISNLKLSYESQIHVSRTDVQKLATQREEDTAELQLQCERVEAERRDLEEELRRLRMSLSQTEEQKLRAEEETHSQRIVITEEGRRRRELESQVEELMRQSDQDSNQYKEELAEVMNALQEKSEQLAYVTHSLEEETRRRKNIEEGQVVLEQSLTQLQVKLTNSSITATQVKEFEVELETTRLELERERKERSRVEQNVSRLQGRIKDLQTVRDELESQVENLRMTIQEEVARRSHAEAELEKTTMTMTEYTSTICALRQSQEQASTSGKRGEEERRMLQEELERSLKQSNTYAERATQLGAELKALQQQLLQEQTRVTEANLRNEGLYRTIEEKIEALNVNSAEFRRLKEETELQTKHRLRLEEELRTARHEHEKLMRSKQGSDDELSSQITALDLQLQASERSNKEYRNLISELSSEREKLKLETERFQKQATEMTAMVQSTQSQYSEIVKERDALLLKFQYSEKDKDSSQMLEEELARIKLSLDSELRNKQHLQEENERVKRDLTYWKDQYESKQSLMRQHDTDKEHMERENYSLKSEIDRLMRELRELEETNKSRVAAIQKELQEVTTVRKTMENELKSVREPPTLDASTVTFDGVRKPVTAKQLLDCGVLDKPIFNQLVKGHKTVPEVSEDKKVSLKGTGPIAGVVVEGPKGPGSISGPCFKMTFTEAKAQNLLPPDSVALLLDAQAATGHIIDPRSNQKLTVEEACNQGVVDEEDRERLSAAEAAAVGYRGPGTGKPLSVFQAMKKGLIDKNTTLRLLQAQESVGGILDPIVSVFLPKDMAMERDLFDDDIDRALNKKPKLYLDPESEEGVTYMSMKRKCKVELNTGLLLLPVSAATDPSKLVFDGVRKTVTAKQLHDCGVLDKPTFKDLINGKKAVEEVSVDKSVILKGTGPIAGIVVGSYGKMSLSEAKKQMFLPVDCADLLLEAQAATGHIIDPINNQKLTVDEACTRGVVDIRDRDKLLAAEAAAVGYKESTKPKPLSVFEAIKKGLIDKKTGLRHLQAQESVGGILDPNLSVFLPKDIAIKRNLLDENLHYALNRNSTCFLDPETEQEVSYGALKKICKTEPHTGLLLLPVTEKLDPSQLIFDGVRKSVTAQQLLDCGVLDKRTFNQLIKGEKTVPEVSVDKKIFLKGTGSIAGVAAGPLGKMLLSEAKKQMLMPTDSADLLLDAQAATGHIIDTTTNQKLTVEEACAIGVVDNRDRDRLLVAEAAAVGYRDPTTGKPLSVSEAIKKGLIDKKTGLRLLQAQESAGGILDPNLSVFLPRETAIKRKLLDTDLCYGLDHSAKYYVDPDTECDVSYGALKKKSKTESHTGLILLPIIERKDPSKLMFEGVRKPVSAKQLFDCGVLDKPTFNQLMKGEKTVQMVSREKMVYLKGTGAISGVVAGNQGKLSLVEAKKQNLMPDDSAYLLLEAQAATGYIIDPKTNQKLTVEEACAKGVVDIRDRQRLLVAEAAAVGYDHPSSDRPLSVYEAMKKGIIDRKTALRYLQAQESVGGILDPILSVFLPKEIAMKRNLLDETLCHALKLNPACYLDPEPEHDVSYGVLKGRCMKESNTGLQFLQISEHFDPSKLVFDGVRKTVTAEQLLESGILDKSTFHQLIKGEKSVQEVSVDKKLFLKGTGSIAGVASGPSNKMSLSEAKKKKVMNSNCADMLLDAQAATGHIIDPKTNQKLTVKEACAKGLVAKEDESRLFAFEAAAIGYRGPNTSKVLSAGQALRIGLIDKDTTLRILQAQESVGGILDPALSVFIPKDIALGQGLIDEALYHALNQCPKCYLDPATQQATTYVSLKKQCKVDPTTGLLFLPEPKKPLTVQGLRGQVSVKDLVDANLLEVSVMDQLSEGRLTSQEIENRLRSYLRGSTCIAGVYDEASDKVMPIYQAMKDKLLRPGTTLELLEAQAASGFIVDPVNNLFLTVSDAYNKRLFGPEFKTSLLAAERAVTGYKLPGTDKIISLFGAIERGLVEKGHGIRLLEAQIASGGIIDPEHSHRIDVNVAYKRGYFDENMNKILTDESDDSKGFFDPNTEENLTYLELKKRCITDKNTGLILLPIIDQKKLESTQQNTRRKRRVVIVDPETNKEMTIREAYNKGYIDHDTFLELSEQECEWEEITITAPDGSKRFVIIDKKAGIQYDIDDLLEKGVINKSDIDKYRSNNITLTQLADIVTDQTRHGCSLASRASAASVTSSVMSSLTSRKSESSGPSSVMSSSTFRTSESSGPSSVMSSSTFRTSESSGQSSGISSSSVVQRPLSPTLAKMTTTRTTTITERSATVSSATQDFPDSLKQTSSVSITLASPVEAVGEQEPVGAIFDTENVEKISIMEALNRGLVDSITAQRLLEAQACTGGIVNPANGQRVGIQEASRLGIISDDMASNLKPAQKAYFGFEDVKTRRKMSVAEALKEMWLPYEAGQRFMEFQFVTGGLYDPEADCRRSIEDALKLGWLDMRSLQKLQDIRHHSKILTCPKSKLKISYKEALDNCMVEESSGVKMLQASSVSSRGISSPYNVSSAPGSTTGSRSGSRRTSRRSSMDLGSSSSLSAHYSHTSFTSYTSK